MFKNMCQAVLASLLLFVSLHAQSVSVWTLDEQLSSNNLTVLRFRVQNTGQQTIRGLELHYRVKQEWSGIAPAEGYYIPGGNAEWVQSNNGEALLKMPESPDDSLTFEWTAVEGFQLYQLHIVRDSAYGDTLNLAWGSLDEAYR